MKLRRCFAAFLTSAAIFSVPLLATASIDANLKYGARGSEVIELQEFLIAKGFLSGPASGNFFSLTRKAVIAYQQSVGLPASGFVGPMTRNAINQELAAADTTSASAEVAETGSTTQPTNNSQVEVLKQQVALLMEQLKAQTTLQTSMLQQQQQTQTTLQQTQQSIQQIQQNTTPPPPPPVAPATKKEIVFSAQALDPTKYAEVQVNDGDTVYKNPVVSSPTFPDGVAQVDIEATYLIDGVPQKTYAGQWSYEPWDFNITGLPGTTFSVNCPQSGRISGNVCTMPMGGPLSITGKYTFTATVSGISKSFTINVQPDPICAGMTGQQCGVGYLARLASSTASSTTP
jgi:peptidoglycan hydrolase-like protein with peptidoglycan-binding domain